MILWWMVQNLLSAECCTVYPGPPCRCSGKWTRHLSQRASGTRLPKIIEIWPSYSWYQKELFLLQCSQCTSSIQIICDTNIFSFTCRIQKRLELGEIEYGKSYEKETDHDVLERRKKQIDYGRNTPEYANYCRLVPMWVAFINVSYGRPRSHVF